MTGEPNRLANLGSIANPNRKFEWKNFCFSACEECNSKFGHLESQAKIVIEKLVSRKLQFSELELVTLLDWLDKIRIGLWLGFLQLDKIDFIEPKFHIQQRIRLADRMAAIYFLKKDEYQGINFFGTNTIAFHFAPSCFLLIINNLAIFSYSKEFLFSRRLGFPFPTKIFFLPSNTLTFEALHSGFARVIFPLLKKPLIENSLNIFQAITSFTDKDLTEYVSKIPYYKKYFKNGMSKLFIEVGNKEQSFFMENSIDVNSYKEMERISLVQKLVINILDNQILSFYDFNSSSMSRLDDSEKQSIFEMRKAAVSWNLRQIKEMRKSAFY